MPYKPGDIIVTNLTTRTAFGGPTGAISVVNLEFTVRGFGPVSVEMPQASYASDILNGRARELANEIITVIESGLDIQAISTGVAAPGGTTALRTIRLALLVRGKGPFFVDSPLPNFRAADLIAKGRELQNHVISSLSLM